MDKEIIYQGLRQIYIVKQRLNSDVCGSHFGATPNF